MATNHAQTVQISVMSTPLIHLIGFVILNNDLSPNPNFPPPPWYDTYQPNMQYRVPVRQTIKRDNRLSKSLSLSIIAVSNLRSLIPKIKNLRKIFMNGKLVLGC